MVSHQPQAGQIWLNRHSGRLYRIRDRARNTTTGEVVVTYEPMEAHHVCWRHLDEFLQKFNKED